MFWLKRQDKTERQLAQMNETLSKSFANVKRDTHVIFQWLNHFNSQHKHQQQLIQTQQNHIKSQQQQIAALAQQLHYIPKRPEDIKRVVDSYYSYDALLERIRSINEKIDALSHARMAPQSVHQEMHPVRETPRAPQITQLQERLSSLEEQRKSTIKEKVMARITRHSKEYVKSLILSYIRKHGQISALQLHDLIVVDQGLCSKSSFYRVLEELERSSDIGFVKEGKQKYYVYKPLKQQ